jgi:tetratricopeptide (TPR) repeat protein
MVASLPAGDPARARVLPVLAEAQEATGDRAAAARTYARAATEFPKSQGTPVAALGAGRLLQEEGKWFDAQPLLERAIETGDAAIAAEAAFHKGEGLRASGQHEDAVEAYMTAAYVAPDSIWGRRALVGAGMAFAALKQNDAAAIVYRKLLAASSAEPELQSAARRGLSALGAN